MNQRPALPNPFFAALAGAAGGFAGAFLAHILVTLSLRAGGELWLKGPHGPGQFFGTALYSGVLYGAIGLALSRRKGAALLGFFGAFLGIALPMAVLTRTTAPMAGLTSLIAGSPRLMARLLSWWPDLARAELPALGLAWTLVVTAVFLFATWGATLGLGAWLCPARRLRGAGLAALGSLAGYLALRLLLSLVPSYTQGRWVPTSLIPSPVDLLTGLLIGAGMSLGIYLAGPRPSRAPGPEAPPA